MGTMKRLSLAVLMVVLLMAGLAPAAAQDGTLYVCRDPRFEWVRLEFHNIPSALRPFRRSPNSRNSGGIRCLISSNAVRAPAGTIS